MNEKEAYYYHLGYSEGWKEGSIKALETIHIHLIKQQPPPFVVIKKKG